MESDVRQGASLSPLLFVIVIEHVRRKVKRAKLSANDTYLRAENLEDIIRLTESLVDDAGDVGL